MRKCEHPDCQEVETICQLCFKTSECAAQLNIHINQAAPPPPPFPLKFEQKIRLDGSRDRVQGVEEEEHLVHEGETRRPHPQQFVRHEGGEQGAAVAQDLGDGQYDTPGLILHSHNSHKLTFKVKFTNGIQDVIEY